MSTAATSTTPQVGHVPVAHTRPIASWFAAVKALAVRWDGAFAGAVPALAARTIQEHLAPGGYLTASDTTGCFDRPTAAAVRAFQEANGLEVDGVAGRATCDALLAA